MTNIELVEKMMNAHPMNQLFIMDAIGKMANLNAKLSDEEVAELQEKAPFINMTAWREAGVRIKKELDNQ